MIIKINFFQKKDILFWRLFKQAPEHYFISPLFSLRRTKRGSRLPDPGYF
jgi:hypothetical protein